MDSYVNEPWPSSTQRTSNIVVPLVQNQASGGASEAPVVVPRNALDPVSDQGSSNEDYSLLALLNRVAKNPQDDTSSSLKGEYDKFESHQLSQWAKVMQGLMAEDSIPSSRFVEVCRLRSIEQELREGDTLVFIDFPDVSRRQWRRTDCYGMPYSSKQFRVHSKKLLATGSAKFADMLSPTYQFRIQRRKKLAKNLPEGIKYVLDLTPPSEGDELVFQMTQLSLTPGIIKWWASNALHKVSNWLVSGHDDVCACGQSPIPGWGLPREEVKEQRLSENSNGEPESDNNNNNNNNKADGIDAINGPKLVPPSPQNLLDKKLHGIDQPYETPEYRNIPDYCPTRHCNSIIRLLLMIEGRDVMLDSANRVWTLVALAKIFDCTSVIRDQVTQWLMYDDNTKFIEVLPEEALQIAFALELTQVAQCAFRILVNELALKDANTDSKRDLSRVTIFGRRLGNLDDELQNIVQHAARALVERVSLIPDAFQSEQSLDCWMVDEWVKLRKMEGILTQHPSASGKLALDALRDLMKTIQMTVSRAFDRPILVNTENARQALISMDEDRATYVLPNDFQLLEDILPSFNRTQKLLCPFIYQQIGDMWDTNYSESKWKTLVYSMSSKRMVRAQAHVQQMVDTAPELATLAPFEMFMNQENGVEGGTLGVKDPLIDLNILNRQIHDAVLPFSTSWVRFDIEPALNLTRHMLLTLDINELKFLPLWAGGCNDGTGGVFEKELPPAQWGPNGPGPAYHTGSTIPSTSSVSGSFVDDFSTMKVRGSTVVGSLDAQDSISTVYARDHVIADSVSVASESFDMDGAEYYQEARFVIPAEHQDTGRAVDMMVESLHSDADTASVMTDRVGSNHDSGDDDVMNIDDPVANVIAQSDESDSDASTLEAWDEI
ncbi:uncharacterized protein Triagg1_2421 [Trichoderma aggressivum f. europaeum]|uniref:Uncharacterized protein n=1 Tax=Trichoderma aggressivum f. europaeum TaxID=173218 RepID=A0AAE1IKR0_9HYPO|nr:hypothetical protein Triagg1_2421 [Trichoderma aggressivum f. europaeum]